MSRKVIGFVAALAAVALGLAFVSSGQAQTPAPGAALSVSSATIAPGGATTCPYNPPAVGDPDPVEATCIVVTLTPDAGTSVGTVVFELAYDTALLDVTGPIANVAAPNEVTPLKGTGACNAATSPITCAIASTGPLGGNIVAFEFTSIAGAGVSPLTLTSGTNACSDTTGTVDFTCTATNGSITIQAATPTPSPTPSPSPTAVATATPTRTPTPAALPQTGGTESDGSGSGLAWVLGALGLAVVAGGVWAVSRTRRHTA